MALLVPLGAAGSAAATLSDATRSNDHRSITPVHVTGSANSAVAPRVLRRTDAPIVDVEATGREVALYTTPLADDVLELYRGLRRLGRWSALCGDPGIGTVALGGGGVADVCALYTNASQSIELRLHVPGRAQTIIARGSEADYESLDVAGDGRRLAYNTGEDLWLYDGRKRRLQIRGSAGQVYALEGEHVVYKSDRDEIVVSTIAGKKRWRVGDSFEFGGGVVLAQDRVIALDDLGDDILMVYEAVTGQRQRQWQLRGRGDIKSGSLTAYGRLAAYFRGLTLHIFDLHTGRDTAVRFRYPGRPPARGALVDEPDAALTREGLLYTYNTSADGPGWVTLVPYSTLERLR